MIRSIKQTLGAGIDARDGAIGAIQDIYFDDNEWVVRYYVVDTGKWLPGRKVLIPPQVVRQTTPSHAGVPVDLTREQIRQSPDVDMDRPISRQSEMVLYRHYGWTPYWTPLMPASPAIEGDAAQRENWATSGQSGGDPHLRSAKEATGYDVAAVDGDIGHIEDFLIDDETAKVRYVVVDTRNWLPGKNVLIAPEWISEMRWSESKAFVGVPRESVRNSPEYNAAAPVDRAYESRLFQHYGYPVPWL